MWVAWGEAPDLGSGVDERVSQLIDLALVEDIGPGDVTSEFFVPGDRMARAFLVAKENGVVAGVEGEGIPQTHTQVHRWVGVLREWVAE